MARSPVRGVAKTRRMFRRLPDAARGEVLVELNVTGRQINQAVLAKAPRKTGATRAGISFRVLPVSMRLQIGLLGSPKERSRIFYARIQDLGRKAQTVAVAARRNRRAYVMKVAGMAPKRFITGRYPDLRAALRRNLRDIFARSLRAVSGGGDE